MKQGFKIGLLQIQNNFHSVKYWIAILLQVVQTMFYTLKIKNLSTSMGEPVNVFDGYLITTSSEYMLTVGFLIFLFMMSDIPYVNEITSAERLRTSKKQWIFGKILSIPVSAIILQITSIVTSILILAPNGFIQNIWSRPFYQITMGAGSGTLQYQGIGVLMNFRPYMAVIIQSTLLILFESSQVILLYILCINFGKIISYAIVVVIHIAGFFMNSINRIQFLPFPHAIMASMYSVNGNGSNFVRGCAYYAFILLALFWVLGTCIERGKYDELV